MSLYTSKDENTVILGFFGLRDRIGEYDKKGHDQRMVLSNHVHNPGLR